MITAWCGPGTWATELELEGWLHPQLHRGRGVVQGMVSKTGASRLKGQSRGHGVWGGASVLEEQVGWGCGQEHALAFIPPAMGRALGKTLNGLEGLRG